MASSLDLGTLKIAIGVENAEANKQINETKNNMDNAANSAKSFGDSFGNGFKSVMKGTATAITAVTTAAIAVGTAIFSAAKETASACDEIDKASQRMGVDVEYYQELEFAAEQCGVSMSTLEKAAKQLEASGSELSFDEAIEQILACGDAAESAALASELFGDKVAYELQPLLNQGAEGFEELRAQAEEYGLVVSSDTVAAGVAFSDSLNLMETSIDSVKNKLLSDFLPALTDIVTGIAGVVTGVEDAQNTLEKGISEFIGKINSQLPKIISNVSNILSQVVSAVASKLPSLVKSVTSTITNILKKIDGAKFAKKVVDIVTDLVSVVADALPDFLTAVTKIVIGISKQLVSKDTINKLTNAIWEIIVNLAAAILESSYEIIKAAIEVIDELCGGIFGVYKEKSNDVIKANEDLERSAKLVASAQQEMGEQMQESIDTLEDFKDSVGDTVDSIDAEYDSVYKLWDQLQDLADSNGYVDDSNIDLANTIIQELNNALGTEYSLNGNLISQYGNMCDEIDNLIEKKKALALSSVWEDQYTTAISNQQDALEQLYNYSNWLTGLQKILDTDAGFGQIAQIGVQYGFLTEGRDENGAYTYTNNITGQTVTGYGELNSIFQPEAVENYIEVVKEAYASVTADASEYYAFIDRYEKAQMAMLEGDYETAIKIMQSYSTARWENMEENHQYTEQELADLEKDLDTASWYAQWYKEQFDKGLEGFTEEGLKEAQDAANELQQIWDEASGEASEGGEEIGEELAAGIESTQDDVEEAGEELGDAAVDGMDVQSEADTVGQQVGGGLASGLRSTLSSVLSAAGELANGIIGKLKSLLGIASPSKVAAEIGKFLDEGLANGITDNIGMVEDEAETALQKVLDIFDQANSYDGFSTNFKITGQDDQSEGNANGNTITQNNYFTSKETTPYEQQLEIYRLNKELMGVFV